MFHPTSMFEVDEYSAYFPFWHGIFAVVVFQLTIHVVDGLCSGVEFLVGHDSSVFVSVAVVYLIFALSAYLECAND